MLQERSRPVNPGEDVPPATQPTSGGTIRPSLALSLFGDGNMPSHTLGRYWSLLNDPGLTPPPPNPRISVVTPEDFKGLTNRVQAITGVLQAIIPYIPQLTQQPSSQPQAASLPQTRVMLPQNGQPPTTRSIDNLPYFSPESDQAPSGGAARRPEPAPSASAHSLSDPDTLSSDSIDSLREQLRMVNQRIDNVHRTLRTKDEHGDSPLHGSPFIQEIQDTPGRAWRKSPPWIDNVHRTLTTLSPPDAGGI
ncbi:hypothetical protein B296_00004600 [Ensete ventricosum]|uniref:Uncharacterized protein n=1 Tax=Ensete ventricosum TaxID=4639 RepID=A0A427AK53_ENSVE|nr:hypothetical protein B296_00004600 [Ensete ventricosum]